jgi:hypothetical protein
VAQQLAPLSLVNVNRVIQTFFPEEVDKGAGTPRRHRSIWYVYARESLRRVVDLGKESLDLRSVIRYFELWLAKYKDQFIRLERVDSYKFVRCVNRFCSVYRRELKRRARRLKKFRFDVKLELTLDPKKFFNLKDEFDFLPVAWNKFRSWMLKKYGKFEFLRILEVQKKGRPHLHVLFSFYDEKRAQFFASMRSRGGGYLNFKSFHSAVKSEWGKVNGGHVWVKPIQGNMCLVNYVMKYVNKSLNVSAQDDKSYSALLFASNRRMWSISHGFKVFSYRKKPSQGYVYSGIVSYLELQSFCVEEGLLLRDFMTVPYDTGWAYNYPSLFNIQDF